MTSGYPKHNHRPLGTPISDQFQSNSYTHSGMHLSDRTVAHQMDNFEILAQPLTHSTRPLRETSETFFDAKDYIEDSRGELQRLQDENEDLRKKWTDACANLADIQSVVSYKLDDGHFMSEWKLLQKLIHEWGATHFSNRMPIAQYGTRLVISAKKLQNLGRHWKHYAGSNERRPLLAQAVLWGFLQSDVFAFPFGNLSIGPGMRGAYWAHPYQTDIAHLNERLRDACGFQLKNPREFDSWVRDYMEWRLNNIVSMQKLASRHQGTNKPIVTLVDQIKGMLGHYTDSNAFDRELKEIIGKAVSLDADMWKQKAYFRILRPVIDRYDSESMELYSTEQLQDDTPNPRVTLVISPSLTKTGDSSGERYSTSTTIVKCVVSCMETDAPPRSKAMAGNFKRMIGRPSSRASNHPAVMDSTTSITKPIDTSTQPPADIVGTLTMSLSNVDGDRRHDSREPVPTRRDERGPLEPWPEPTAKDQWMPESRPPPIAKDEQNPRPNAHVHPKLPDDNIDHPHHRPSTSERTAGGPERFGTSTADPLRMSPNRNFGPRPQPPSGPVRRSSGRNRVPPDLSGRTRF